MNSPTYKNSVINLILNQFSSYTYEQKIEIKQLGRPTPDLKGLINKAKKGKNEYIRHFNTDYYAKHKWLCGCDIKLAVYCFPCLCFGGDISWTKTGITHLGHLSEKIKKHENSFKHLQNEASLKVLGTINIFDKIDSGYKIRIQRHNEEIDKNRYILEKILNCIKFCGQHNLPLRGHNEKINSNNKGVFLGVIELCKDLDVSLRSHFENSKVFKGTSKTIQNDLLDCILLVARNQILLEIENAQFVSIIVDETTDISNMFQLVIVFRYEINGQPVERFWGFFNPDGHNAESLTSTILSEINPILKNTPNKLIAQSYDGAAVMSGQKSGVNVRVKELYPYAYYIHCYAHQLNLIMTQSVSQNKEVRIFFSNLSEIPVFFSNSPQRVAVLDKLVGVRLPRAVQTRWNFNIRTVNIVYEYRNEIMECMDKIIESSQQTLTINQAGSIKRLLNDSIFVFWLSIFHKIMPHVDCLYNNVQAVNTDPVQINSSVEKFKNEISKIRNNVTDIIENASNMPNINIKKSRLESHETMNISRKNAVLEVCDTIIVKAKDRLEFTKHLTAANLFKAEKYLEYSKTFPFQYFQCTTGCYTFFDTERLKTELEVMYSRDDFRTLNGVIPTLKYITANDMNETFREVLTLLKILITIPMTSSEAERCFSTLKRIKTCLRSTIGEERLNALTIINIENEMISKDANFNKKVIDIFSETKDRRLDFKYKVL